MGLGSEPDARVCGGDGFLGTPASSMGTRDANAGRAFAAPSFFPTPSPNDGGGLPLPVRGRWPFCIRSDSMRFRLEFSGRLSAYPASILCFVPRRSPEHAPLQAFLVLDSSGVVRVERRLEPGSGNNTRSSAAPPSSWECGLERCRWGLVGGVARSSPVLQPMATLYIRACMR